MGGAGLDPGKLLMVVHLGPFGGNCNTIAEGTRGVGPDGGLPFAAVLSEYTSSKLTPTGKWDPGDAIDHIPRPGIQSAGGCFTEQLQRDSGSVAAAAPLKGVVCEAATQPGACTNGTQLTRTPTGVEG